MVATLMCGIGRTGGGGHARPQPLRMKITTVRVWTVLIGLLGAALVVLVVMEGML